ncbi:hypothetical protein [Endozoicomonas euniceicola]|uniref:Uncharacterized protein n=1 Tax=Endozoicomonas euniceicola TaxID=1234143 RepID=A0ABY6H0F7_9GAMM|nr:hypothetical protein [Endozoicomonas euniceicola]UYM18522.1 hypothetical protein NX720_11670 [Endozoicomonas euniceicola]
MNNNSGLENLLMLNGEEYTDDKGYKIRIQVMQVKPDTTGVDQTIRLLFAYCWRERNEQSDENRHYA